MPTFIKTGFWESSVKSYKGWLNLEDLISNSITSSDVTNALGYTPVPNTRTLTINGVTQDLSADRTFTIAAGITGSGVANQLTYWNGTGSVTGSAGLTYVDSTGIMTLSKNQNAATYLNISNTTSGTSAQSILTFTSSAGINAAQVGKTSGTFTTYKLTKANDFAFYNGASNVGDIVFLNDNNVGKIIFGAGATSTAQMTLTSAGRLLLGTTTESTFLLDVNGTARVTGDSRVQGDLVVIGTTTNRGISVGGTLNDARVNIDATSQSGLFFKISGVEKHQLIGVNGAFYIKNSSFQIISVWGETNTLITDALSGTSIAASAQLEVRSTLRGFLPPRLTTTQKNAIGSPAAGLQVYDTTLNQMSYYNGTTWVNF
jgi:hypothetical protein